MLHAYLPGQSIDGSTSWMPHRHMPSYPCLLCCFVFVFVFIFIFIFIQIKFQYSIFSHTLQCFLSTYHNMPCLLCFASISFFLSYLFFKPSHSPPLKPKWDSASASASSL
ncbi:hypothetical protein VNO80_00040 [Phaseolus coccineus]|uniref:Uncharacterized protein n=1 Tax=Phaseolus coccineus TaxID=3886 RepID=A0AAN9NYQ1_PHACN